MDPSTAKIRCEWAPLNPEGDKPSPRGGHSAVAAGSSIVVFGGTAYGGDGKFNYFNDTHLFDVETGRWYQIKCSGENPEARYGQCAVLVGSRMFMFGGKDESTIRKDMFFLDLVEWAWVPVNTSGSTPTARLRS
jgi:N-acetylneuraminic acid mutarotase